MMENIKTYELEIKALELEMLVDVYEDAFVGKKLDARQEDKAELLFEIIREKVHGLTEIVER